MASEGCFVSIKQRPEENTTAYFLRFLSEAKLAYPTAWAMGEESKVASFLKGFTDRAFADHLLRTVQANTLGTATEVALEKEADSRLSPSGQITNAVRSSLRSTFFGPNSFLVPLFRNTVKFLWQNGKFTLVIAVKWVFSIYRYDHFDRVFLC